MEKWRQKLHIEPPDGWLNDPNGLSFYKGKYHVYFQYSPKSPEGKTLRCWGHYSGENLLDLQYDDIVLVPDMYEDKDGVYSGSAIVHEDLLHIFYTGNVKEEGVHDYIRTGRGANVIHVTTKDGHAMSEKKVLLRNENYPDFCSCHVRDPKVWWDQTEWKMVLGARSLDGEGCVLVYRSGNLEDWEYVNAVTVPEFGYMWECPDYFELDGKGFLSISPQGLPHYDTKYQNVFQAGYFDVKGKLIENKLGVFSEWDMGFDFYAPQTFETPEGRRILIAWMGMDRKSYDNATISLGWQHCLTLPREITVDEDGRLLQSPVKELLKLRQDKRQITDGETVNLNLPFELYGKTSGDFEMNIDGRLTFHYDSEKEICSLVFADAEYGCGRTVRRAELSNCSDIRVIADMSSLEIYLDGGKTVMSTRFYPDSDEVKLGIKGFDAKLWSLCTGLKDSGI